MHAFYENKTEKKVMYKDLKFALDRVFLFVLFVNLVLFGLELLVDVNRSILHTIESIDFGILGGYYGWFGYELSQAKQKLAYVKSHWVLCVFLIIPFLPFARMIPARFVARIVDISGSMVWHVLDELEML